VAADTGIFAERTAYELEVFRRGLPELADEEAVQVGVVGLESPSGFFEGGLVVGEVGQVEAGEEAEGCVQEGDERGGEEMSEVG
jgi:hypothetical protein